jgi:hypothetical protein
MEVMTLSHVSGTNECTCPATTEFLWILRVGGLFCPDRKDREIEMGLFHRHDYQPDRTEHKIDGYTVKKTRIVKCSCCGKEGVSHVNTELNPKFRDKLIDRQ